MNIQKSNRSGSRTPAWFAPGLAAVLGLIAVAAPSTARAGFPPVVTNVTAMQQALPSKLVDIYYTLSDADSLSASISILVSSNSGATWTVPATSFTGDYGPIVSDNATPTVKHVVWNAGADFNGQFSTTCRVRVIANDDNYTQIPGGTFMMGDNLDSEADAQPFHSVTNSSFYIDTNLVTGAGWALVLNYAATNGYTFVNYGSYIGLNHPVQSVDWYDVVKWCNARSEMLGATPVYYTDATFTNVYRTGEVAPYVNTNANGYRLPTEAEWEKAARGGLTGNRFPLGTNIDETLANYRSLTNYTYDLGPYGYNSNYVTATTPYTSPVGSFPPNGYGMYDMAGNVYEWCLDWYGNYPVPTPVNYQGPSANTGARLVRGGSWNFDASTVRCAARGNVSPNLILNNLGFRCVRSY